MAKYAEGTSVSIARSRAEIEKLLARHSATGFMYGEQGERAMIAFELEGRRYRMGLVYLPVEEFRIAKVNQYSERERTPSQMKEAYEQNKQRLWRGLVLLVKAKLEAIDSGISTLEEEMLSYTVMPNNETVGDWLEPQLEEAYRSGTMPPLLPGIGGRSAQKQIGSGYIEGEIVR